MRLAKNVALFGGFGLGLSLAIAGLSSVAPNIFGWLTVPFWLLSALANLGAHDLVNLPLFVLSGTICYGLVAFVVFKLVRRHHVQR
jgi:hypothetical protein